MAAWRSTSGHTPTLEPSLGESGEDAIEGTGQEADSARVVEHEARLEKLTIT